MKNDEKRKHSRIDSMNLLNYVYSDENEEEANQGMGRTLNVSESGILLETHNRIAPFYIVSLTIGFEESMVDIKGRVIYTKENIRGMFESGIEFFEMDDSARKILKSYIQAFNAQSAG
jgi:PilZ domain